MMLLALIVALSMQTSPYAAEVDAAVDAAQRASDFAATDAASAAGEAAAAAAVVLSQDEREVVELEQAYVDAVVEQAAICVRVHEARRRLGAARIAAPDRNMIQAVLWLDAAVEACDD